MWKEEREEKIMKITIINNGEKLAVKTDTPVTSMEVLYNLFSAQLALMNDMLSKVPKEDREEAKGDLYDKYNFAASNILDMFAPELELRPNLTTKAILEAENKILERESSNTR